MLVIARALSDAAIAAGDGQEVRRIEVDADGGDARLDLSNTGEILSGSKSARR